MGKGKQVKRPDSLYLETNTDILKQGCRSRPEPSFWLEPEPFFWSGSGSYSYSTINILFLRDPKYDYDYDYDYGYD